MKKPFPPRVVWFLAFVLSAWCYFHLYSLPHEQEKTALQTQITTLEEEAGEEDATFYLPDVSLLKKALDLAGRLAGFGEP